MQPISTASFLVLTLVTALCFAPAAQAAREQPEVVVTATRMPVTVDASLASVTVLTRGQIEASGANDLYDLLRAVPGLDIVRSGGIGQQTSVFMRGTNSNHVLVLIDGVRVSATGAGLFTWEQMALGQIERIEIVRGPRAAVWGSDAIGGVIQVFTRRIAGHDAALSVGNHGTAGAEVGMGQRGDRGGFDLRLGYLDADGISAQNPDGFGYDPDDDGQIQRNVLLHGDYMIARQRLQAMASQRRNDIEFDQGESETLQSQYSLALDGELGAGWNHQFGAAASRDRLTTPAFGSRYDSRRAQIDWNHTLSLGERDQLLLGLGYVRERGENFDTFSNQPVYLARRNNRAGSAAWRHARDAHDLEFSVRHDDNSAFGTQNTYSGAWGWQLSQRLRTSLSLGEGFRAPTLNELYSPGFGGLFAGNPALDPEHSRSVELGAELQLRADARLGARVYRNSIRDLVDFSGGDTFQAVNILRARIDGIELDGAWQHAGWDISANATWQDARDRDTGAALLRRPARKANLLLDRRFDTGWRLGLEAHAVSRRPEFGGELPGYGLLSLRGRIPLGPQLVLDARLENLLDRDYTLVRGFNTPGLTALVTLRWNPAD